VLVSKPQSAIWTSSSAGWPPGRPSGWCGSWRRSRCPAPGRGSADAGDEAHSGGPVRRASRPRARPEALRRGEIIRVFPEATISESFTLKSFKTGAATAAADAGVPLLPMALWGPSGCGPKGARATSPVATPRHDAGRRADPAGPGRADGPLSQRLRARVRNCWRTRSAPIRAALGPGRPLVAAPPPGRHRTRAEEAAETVEPRRRRPGGSGSGARGDRRQEKRPSSGQRYGVGQFSGQHQFRPARGRSQRGQDRRGRRRVQRRVVPLAEPGAYRPGQALPVQVEAGVDAGLVAARSTRDQRVRPGSSSAIRRAPPARTVVPR